MFSGKWFFINERIQHVSNQISKGHIIKNKNLFLKEMSIPLAIFVVALSLKIGLTVYKSSSLGWSYKFTKLYNQKIVKEFDEKYSLKIVNIKIKSKKFVSNIKLPKAYLTPEIISGITVLGQTITFNSQLPNLSPWRLTP
jgi:hypothetical protein